MSGIAGILTLDAAPVNRVLLEQMTRFMSWRGPDAQTCWLDGHAGLGHALLQTTFESEPERQPCTRDGQVWITADARIDGRAELIAKLRAQGRDLGSTTDDITLILHAYAVWETNCVHHLIGDFAFAIWDTRYRQLFCARDQFGVAPFYHAHINNEFVFSNTLECVRLHPAVSDKLNEQAIGDMLLFGMNFDPTTTTFVDIHQLPPAHTLTIRDGVVRCTRYWSLPQSVALQFRPAQETVAQFRALFEQAVCDRLRTNRVAVPLSGGMDSSSVAVTARRMLARERADFEMRAYTISVNPLMHDEEPHYAGLVAAHANIPIQYVVQIPPDTLKHDDGSRVNPEPRIIPPLDASLEMMTDASAFSRVLLSGLGGDPLLFPSSTFLFDALRRGQWAGVIQACGEHIRIRHKLPPFYLRSSFKRRVHATPTLPMPEWLNSEFAGRLGLEARWHEVNAAQHSLDERNGMAASPFWSNVLANADPGFTRFPIKYRFPFFDVRLLNFILTVPPVPWFVGKTLLREAMRGDLPEAVRRRRKTPLSVNPLLAQARQRPITWMKELAATPELEPYVNREALQRSVEEPGQISPHEFYVLYHALALAYWLRASRAQHKLHEQKI